MMLNSRFMVGSSAPVARRAAPYRSTSAALNLLAGRLRNCSRCAFHAIRLSRETAVCGKPGSNGHEPLAQRAAGQSARYSRAVSEPTLIERGDQAVREKTFTRISVPCLATRL